jgi:hypothetical protein
MGVLSLQDVLFRALRINEYRFRKRKPADLLKLFGTNGEQGQDDDSYRVADQARERSIKALRE